MQQGKQEKLRTARRSGRLGIGLACAAFAVAVVPGGTAGAASPPAGNSSTTIQELLGGGGAKAGKDAPNRVDLQRSLTRQAKEAQVEAAAAAVARRARIGSAAARAERRRSKSAFGELGAASALRLTQQQFGNDLAAVSATAADSLAADRVLGFEDDFTARVVVPGADEHQLAISTVQPFRVRDDAGKKALVDLGLEATEGGFAPVNPIVDVTLPASSDGALTVGDDLSLTASIPGGGASTARHAGDSSLFYPEAGTDTDLVATPTSSGLETFFTLRSADAPETASLTFDLPEGASLLAQADGSVNVVRDGRRIGRVSAPVAKDAQGTPVATSASVDGSTVTVTTPHRGKDVAYPILVDPIVEVDSLDPAPDVANTYDPLGTPGSLPTGVWSVSEDAPSGTVADTGGKGDGLYLHDESTMGSYNNVWFWTPPQRNNHIYDADLAPFDLELNGDTLVSGTVVAGMVNEEGSVSDSVSTETADGSFELSDENTDTENPGFSDVSLIGFSLVRWAPFTHDHDAFLGGAVMHVEDLDDSDGPRFDGIDDPESLPTDTVWMNANEVTEGNGLAATSYSHGVKRIEYTAQSGSGPEVVLGYVEDPCDGTSLDPCPTHLGADGFDVDWSLLTEGHYTWRIRAIDGASNETVLTVPLGIDRTAPDATLGGSLAALDGLTTASTATLHLTVAGETTDDLAISGSAYLSVNDSLSEFSVNLDCSVDDCEDVPVDMSTLSEGEHTFTAQLYDRAGNGSEEHVTFTIDRP